MRRHDTRWRRWGRRLLWLAVLVAGVVAFAVIVGSIAYELSP